MLHILRYFLPLAIVTTCMCGLIYLVVQQEYRLSANDPQIQLAEDAGIALSLGQHVADIVPSHKVDITSSLAPYIMVFDNKGQPIASSGTFNNQLPVLPQGVFNYVDQNGEDRLTWQPVPGIRQAIVIAKYVTNQGTGYVAAGRSLREVEKRETDLEMQVGIGWIATLIASFIATYLFLPRRKK